MKIPVLNNYNTQYKYNKKAPTSTAFQGPGRYDKQFIQGIKTRTSEYANSFVESLETKIIKGAQDLTFPRILTMDRISDSFQDDIYNSPGIITDYVLKELNDYIDILPERAEILGDNSILKIFNDLFKYRPSELADIYTGYNEYPFGILQLAGRYGTKGMTEALFDYIQTIKHDKKLCNQTYAYLEKLRDTKYGERIIDRLTQFMNQQGFSYKPINLEPQYGQNFTQKTQVLDKKFSSMVKEYNLYDPKDLKKAIIELTEFCHYDNLLNKPYNEDGDTLLFTLADIVQTKENEEVLKEILSKIRRFNVDFNQKDSMGFTFIEKVLYTENRQLINFLDYKGDLTLPNNFTEIVDAMKDEYAKRDAARLVLRQK